MTSATDNRTTELKSRIKCIDDMTNDLLEISDVLEEHQVNVRLENGQYLNPVSAIRSKVDVIWDEVQAIAATLGSEREKELEELVRDMNAALIHDNCYRWCEAKEPCNLITDGKCQYRERIRELGIEVVTDER